VNFVNPQELQQVTQTGKVGRFSSLDKKYVIAGVCVGLVVVASVLILTRLESSKLWNERNSIFGQLAKTNPGDETKESEKNIVNALTGVEYTEEESKDWKDLRPLGVMINNHQDARPQAGLIDAEFTYEIVAEGGITRFLAFYQSVLPEKIGPIRSAREYYLVLAKEMGDAMLMHHGYSPQALVAIETWPVRSLQRGAAPYWRENPRNVAIEHTLYASGKEVVKKGLELGWEGKSANFYVWQFKDDATAYSAMPQATTIAYDFWYPGDFSAEWTYDSATNDYFRFMGYDSVGKSVPHIDETTNQQLKVKNLIVQFATETKIAGDDKNRLDYEFVGSGKGYVFIDGRVIEVTWSKAERDVRTKYYDMNGSEIRFNRGKFWVSVLPDRNPDFLKFSAEAAPKTN